MLAWIGRNREKKLARKLEREGKEQRQRALYEEQLRKCKAGEHEWSFAYEVQGDGDPNVEGYIRITTATCRVCQASETSIEPCDKDDV